MNLIRYIEVHGDEAVSRQFGVTVRCVQSWRANGKDRRHPRRSKALEMVAKSSGKLTLEGIYAHNKYDH